MKKIMLLTVVSVLLIALMTMVNILTGDRIDSRSTDVRLETTSVSRDNLVLTSAAYKTVVAQGQINITKTVQAYNTMFSATLYAAVTNTPVPAGEGHGN